MTDSGPGSLNGPFPVRAIQKRDGRRTEFDRERIVTAVRRAQDAAQDADPHFAQEVADVVALTLASQATAAPEGSPPPVPTIEEIQDLVERALIEMGRAKVAKAYILYRARRGEVREAGRVQLTSDRAAQMPMVRAREGTTPWDPGRIVSALVEEAGLGREQAGAIATAVAERVHDARLRRVSTTLIRELVAGELLAANQGEALRRQNPVGVPRHDLRSWLARPKSEGDLSETAGCEVLSRFVLDDVLDERTADLHHGGALFVEDLGRPHLPLTRSIPAELCLRREPHPHSGFELLAELAPLLRGTASGLVLEGLHTVAAPMTRAARSTAGLRDLLASLGALAEASGRDLDLSAPGGRAGSFVARLVRERVSLALSGLRGPRLLLTYEELEPALDGEGVDDAAEALLARGELLPVWHGKDERVVAPGCRRHRRERGGIACGGAVALNLPRIARQAGPWREELMHEALVARVQGALDALESLSKFQREHPAAQTTELRERISYAIAPVGLVEALRILGDGEVRAEQGQRLLGVLADAAQKLAEERGLTACITSAFSRRAAARFASLDARGPRASQARLFADLPSPEAEMGAPYSVGFEWPRAAADPSALTTLLTTVRSGIWMPFITLPAAVQPREESHPHLAAWRAFAASRTAPASSSASANRPGDASPLFQA